MKIVPRRALYRIDSDGTAQGTHLIRLEDNTAVPGVRSITWEWDVENKEAHCVIELLGVELAASGLRAVDRGQIVYLTGEKPDDRG
jgi:hypothetical protein